MKPSKIHACAALEALGLSANEHFELGFMLSVCDYIDEVGSLDEIRSKVDAAINQGMQTKKYRRWLKKYEAQD